MFSLQNRLDFSERRPTPLHHYRDFRVDNIHCYIAKATTCARDPMHIHDCAQLWYVLNDSCKMTVNQIEYILTPGKFLVIPPYTPHFIDTSESNNIVFCSCEFTHGFVSDLISHSENNDIFDSMYLQPLYSHAALFSPLLNLDAKTTEKLEALLEELHDEFQVVDEYSLAHLRLLFLKLLTLLLEEYEKCDVRRSPPLHSKYRASIKNALDFIDLHYTQDIRLKDVCKAAMMSTTSFSTIFRQITGQPFAKYINYLRMCRAKSLLRDTSTPLTSIGVDCGFYDAAYFSKMFKQTFGISPSSYRKNNNILLP